MESIKIKTDSQRTLCINDDESRWITFDTEDLNFYARLKDLYQKLTIKQNEFLSKEKEISAIEGVDENGASLAALALVDLQAEFAKSVTDGMDEVFGAGTCERLFGDAFNPEAYGELIKAIMTYISRDREKKLKAALRKTPNDKKVMS
jgi:translation initiation factor 1 (eIF-1/SUI1)